MPITNKKKKDCMTSLACRGSNKRIEWGNPEMRYIRKASYLLFIIIIFTLLQVDKKRGKSLDDLSRDSD